MPPSPSPSKKIPNPISFIFPFPLSFVSYIFAPLIYFCISIIFAVFAPFVFADLSHFDINLLPKDAGGDVIYPRVPKEKGSDIF